MDPFKVGEKYIQETIKIVAYTSGQKQQLVTIILEEIDDKMKLNKIRRTLLEFKQAVSNDHDMTVLSDTISKMDVKQIQFCTEMMNKAFEPMHTHQTLLTSIADTIRSDLTDEQKIEKITNFLL